jgi:hypothetical protein
MCIPIIGHLCSLFYRSQLIHKNNIDHILGTDERKAEIEKGHERQ